MPAAAVGTVLCSRSTRRHAPADGGVGELDAEQDAHIQEVQDSGLDDDGDPDHDGHGLDELR
jgi:hypothetical protein